MITDLKSEHQGFFDTEVDYIVSPSTNIWNTRQFSSTYVSDFTADTCRKYINR